MSPAPQMMPETFRGRAKVASTDGRHRVFVYGSLKSGHYNHKVMGDKRILIGYGRADGFVLVHMGAFPGAVKVPTNGWHIFGEVYEVDNEIFERLDSLEGHPNFYNREEVDVGVFGKAWMYVLPSTYLKDNLTKFIPQGRWEGGATPAFVWQAFRATMPYNPQRPLLSAEPGKDRPGVVVPEIVQQNKENGPIVGPGFEWA